MSDNVVVKLAWASFWAGALCAIAGIWAHSPEFIATGFVLGFAAAITAATKW